ncbi:MAG TPA: hypothetical protein VGQ42_15680 [Candidatus Dormibacteraeota bacterium]|jgi:hypothetical protein|nr:hypothetical protein [Candidatus Dormibacteraeota bacterium]
MSKKQRFTAFSVEQAGRISAAGGYVTGKTLSTAIIGDPASLYVCSDAALLPPREMDECPGYCGGGRCYDCASPIGQHCCRCLFANFDELSYRFGPVTGSTAPRVPVSRETASALSLSRLFFFGVYLLEASDWAYQVRRSARLVIEERWLAGIFRV